jgi:hypothetical protein
VRCESRVAPVVLTGMTIAKNANYRYAAARIQLGNQRVPIFTKSLYSIVNQAKCQVKLPIIYGGHRKAQTTCQSPSFATSSYGISDGELSNMDIVSRRVETLEDALGLIAECVGLTPYSSQ